MPPRTNITLESFEVANMGGDLLALGSHCIFFVMLLIIIETGICTMLCKKTRLRKQSGGGLIEVRDLGKTYERKTCCKRISQTDALINTSFHVNEHECFSLLGENGAGKSTCFKILTQEVQSTSSESAVEMLGLNLDQYKGQIA